jgi:hypothetical protein
MKKYFKLLLAITLIAVLFIIPTVALADSAQEVAVSTGPGWNLVIEYGTKVAATLLITLIGVLGTYLTMQLGKNANLKNINDAQKELIRAAKITVGELQQTMVSQFKAANKDGKLTPQEIASLRAKLLDKTVEKLSAPAYALLTAASVDVEALILGVGESWIKKIASGGTDPTEEVE